MDTSTKINSDRQQHRRRWRLILLGLVILLLLVMFALFVCWWTMIFMPGESYRGELVPLDAPQQSLRDELRGASNIWHCTSASGISADHWSFWQEGYSAAMITDTAPFRYPYYHHPQDTPDKLNFDHMSRVVDGLKAVIGELASVLYAEGV